MAEYSVEVRVTPRAGLLDPEGKAVEHALQSLGFAGAGGVRIGRLIRMELRAGSEEEARTRAEEMCRKLLANPVTEDYAISLAEAS